MIRNAARVLSWRSTAERSVLAWLKVSCLVTAGERLRGQIGIEKDSSARQMGACSSLTRSDELGGDIQAKLLRVLQDHCVMSVGTDHHVGVNVRVIVATNRNLELMMERGQFREDLFHRLNMLSVHLPPLRERVADLKPLIDNCLMKGRSIAPSETSSVDHDFIEALAQLELPGNVRQLENIVRRAALNKIDDTPLSLSDFPPEIWRQLCTQRHVNGGQSHGEGHTTSAVTPNSRCQRNVLHLSSHGWIRRNGTFHVL